MVSYLAHHLFTQSLLISQYGSHGNCNCIYHMGREWVLLQLYLYFPIPCKSCSIFHVRKDNSVSFSQSSELTFNFLFAFSAPLGIMPVLCTSFWHMKPLSFPTSIGHCDLKVSKNWRNLFLCARSEIIYICFKELVNITGWNMKQSRGRLVAEMFSERFLIPVSTGFVFSTSQ